MSRRKSRQAALQALYEKEFHFDPQKAKSPEALNHFAQKARLSSSDENFALRIIQGVQENKAVIDEIIKKHSKNWRSERMTLVDLNIMRIAVFEFMFCSDVPGKSALNEALELAKKFGEKQSVSFVNGILDKALKNAPPALDKNIKST